MEISFELLREAGVRLPGAMGNTIGIVGGLIIGQAAVDANLVSPIVVIVVAFTALCSFFIPDIEILCDCPVRMAWIFRIFDCTAYGVHPSVAAGKLWDSVSHAVCGGRCQ